MLHDTVKNVVISDCNRCYYKRKHTGYIGRLCCDYCCDPFDEPSKILYIYQLGESEGDVNVLCKNCHTKDVLDYHQEGDFPFKEIKASELLLKCESCYDIHNYVICFKKMCKSMTRSDIPNNYCKRCIKRLKHDMIDVGVVNIETIIIICNTLTRAGILKEIQQKILRYYLISVNDYD